MKRYILLLVLVAMMLSLAACAIKKEDDSNLPKYEVAENDELNCVEITIDDVTYRPFGACDEDLLDKKIGVREDSADSVIFTVKGYDPDQWICDMLISGMMDSPMLYKAVGVTDIPGELKQYDAGYGF